MKQPTSVTAFELLNTRTYACVTLKNEGIISLSSFSDCFILLKLQHEMIIDGISYLQNTSNTSALLIGTTLYEFKHVSTFMWKRPSR